MVLWKSKTVSTILHAYHTLPDSSSLCASECCQVSLPLTHQLSIVKLVHSIVGIMRPFELLQTRKGPGLQVAHIH